MKEIQAYRVAEAFRCPHEYQSVGTRGTVVAWDKRMPMEDKRGLLFSENDILVVARSEGNVHGQAVHCRTIGQTFAAEIEAPSAEQVVSMVRDRRLVLLK